VADVSARPSTAPEASARERPSSHRSPARRSPPRRTTPRQQTTSQRQPPATSMDDAPKATLEMTTESVKLNWAVASISRFSAHSDAIPFSPRQEGATSATCPPCCGAASAHAAHRHTTVASSHAACPTSLRACQTGCGPFTRLHHLLPRITSHPSPRASSSSRQRRAKGRRDGGANVAFSGRISRRRLRSHLERGSLHPNLARPRSMDAIGSFQRQPRLRMGLR